MAQLSSSTLASRFWMLVVGSFVVLVTYRLFSGLPVWVDEIITKGILFGAPLWLYAWWSKKDASFFGFEPTRFWMGAFTGLAAGGIFGFIGLISSALKRGQVLIPYLFNSPQFWNEFGLAFATAWWESLFFYALIQSVLMHMWKNELKAITGTTLLFLLFHAPVLLVRSSPAQAATSLFLLAFFAFGQGILFRRTQSIASAVVSHAFWGMALLVYTS